MKTGVRRSGGVALMLLCAAWAGAQTVSVMAGRGDGPDLDPPADVPQFLTSIAPVLIPLVIANGVQLKQYIVGEEFAHFRQKYGDLYAVDAVFDRAMRLSWNNVYEALFISFVATMDHARVGLRLPWIGPLFWFPLTSEFPDEFHRRVDALPKRLYPDTPNDQPGDRDKLQHFFGSALLACVSDSRAAADRAGNFVEWGEDVFIVDGVLDDRDVRANRQGQDFGLRLLEEPFARPSQFFRFVLAGEHRTGPTDGSRSSLDALRGVWPAAESVAPNATISDLEER
jgi:hypothetical protein